MAPGAVGVLVAVVAPVDVGEQVVEVVERGLGPVGVGDAVGGAGLVAEVEEGFAAALGQGARVLGAGGAGEGVEGLEEQFDVGAAVDAAGEGQGAVAAAGHEEFVGGFGVFFGGGAVGVEAVEEFGDDAFQAAGGQGPGGSGEQFFGGGGLGGVEVGDALHPGQRADEHA